MDLGYKTKDIKDALIVKTYHHHGAPTQQVGVQEVGFSREDLP